MSLPSNGLEALRHDAERFADLLPRSSSREEAIDIATKAVETSIKALKLVSDPSEKDVYRTRAYQLMRDAEAIKHTDDWRHAIQRASTLSRNPASQTAGKARVLREPINSRTLSRKEEIIKLRAAFLNGNAFPEWTEAPESSEFELRDGEALFFDESSELPLSDFQHDVLDDWKRPSEALPPPLWFPGELTDRGPVMHAYRDIDLVQDAATDCSVVASLCAGVARSERGHPKMMHNILYPYDSKHDQPSISKNGKYVVRMNFNGCYRRVVIDDRIPTSTTNQVIHVVDKNNPELLWPALLEKAYLKVRGGYDFPGSNSATDLWILTGWIPEQVIIQDDLDVESLWKRVSNAFSYGDVFITMGTGKMSSETEKAIGLAGQHDYAVLDLREVDGQRLLLIKNPWVEGTSWQGRFVVQPGMILDHQCLTAENAVPLKVEADPVELPRDLLNGDDQLTPGTFWMDVENVLQHFESIYLNWNAGLFKFRQDIHFEWDLCEPVHVGAKRMRGPHASLQHTPQFKITADGEGPTWVLLWRHFHNAVPENASSEDIESGRHFIDLNGYITLAVFSAHGQRVMLAEKYIQKGWFVDSPQTLIKIEDVQPRKAYTIVPLEQDLPAMKQSFTISAFSRSPITLSEASPRFAYVNQLPGTWTKDSAGGNTQHLTYCDNPQYSITVPQKTSLSILVEACNQDLNVHVALLHSKDHRVFRVRNRDIIVDSKEYRPGCCLATSEELNPGKYTIICSTFEVQQLGDFSLRIDSSHPTQTVMLPREGAGRVRTELGVVAFSQGETKVAAPLSPRRLVNFYAIARQFEPGRATRGCSGHSNYSQIRLSVEYGHGLNQHTLTASDNGEYSDGASAVRTEPIDLRPDLQRSRPPNCWIVLDRMYVSSESQDERFQVEMFVDQPDAFDIGEWRAWDN